MPGTASWRRALGAREGRSGLCLCHTAALAPCGVDDALGRGRAPLSGGPRVRCALHTALSARSSHREAATASLPCWHLQSRTRLLILSGPCFQKLAQVGYISIRVKIGATVMATLEQLGSQINHKTQSSKRGIHQSLPTGTPPGCLWHALSWRSRWNTQLLPWHFPLRQLCPGQSHDSSLPLSACGTGTYSLPWVRL